MRPMLIGVFLSLALTAAHADEAAVVAQATHAPPAILVGGRAGVILPQALNKLGTNFLIEGEVAYQIPGWERRLGVFLDVGYSQPSASGSRTDPRIAANAGEVDYTTTVRDLSVAFGTQIRYPVGRLVVPYGGIAGQLHLTSTKVEQAAGATDLGTNTEQSARVGFLGRAGLGVHAGPGDVIGELHFEYTPVDHLITGDSNTGHIAIQIGYLVWL